MQPSLLRMAGVFALSYGLAGLWLPMGSSAHFVLTAGISFGLYITAIIGLLLTAVVRGFRMAAALRKVQRAKQETTEPPAEEPVATPSHLWDRRN